MKKTGVIYHTGYYRLSRRLGLLKYLVLAVLTVFTLVLFLTFRQDMTLSHFRYLLRNFDFSPNASSTSGDTIYYNGDPDSVFGFVSGGFATLTDTRVFVTDRSSSTTFSAYHGYREPRGLFSDTYMLIYDRGGSRVTVYNAFAAVNTLSFEGTVLAAALSDSGSYAVAVTAKDSYYSKVYVYDKNGKQVNLLSKYKYVTSLSLTDDGESLLVTSRYSSENGTSESELLVLDVGSKTPRALLTVKDAVYSAAFLADGSLAALTARDVSFYSPDGELLSSHTLEGTAEKSEIGKNGVMTVTSGADSRQKTFTYTDKEGSVSFPLSHRVLSFGEDGSGLYLLTEGELLRFSRQENSLQAVGGVPLEGALMLVCDTSGVYLASSSRAVKLSSLTVESKNTETDTKP